jgi:hypothetical protein
MLLLWLQLIEIWMKMYESWSYRRTTIDVAVRGTKGVVDVLITDFGIRHSVRMLLVQDGTCQNWRDGKVAGRRHELLDHVTITGAPQIGTDRRRRGWILDLINNRHL